jgi:hypothetical protein
MNCTHHMWGDPSGPVCVRDDRHEASAAGGHVYETGDGSWTNPPEQAAAPS